MVSKLFVFNSPKDDQLWGDWVILPKLRRILVFVDSCYLSITASLPLEDCSPIHLAALILILMELSITVSDHVATG